MFYGLIVDKLLALTKRISKPKTIFKVLLETLVQKNPYLQIILLPFQLFYKTVLPASYFKRLK